MNECIFFFHTLNYSFLCACIPDNQMFQYFITVVPTKLNTYKISADTHQFSVTERVSNRRALNTAQCCDSKQTNHHNVCCQGTGDKPRRGQSRCFRHLRQVRHQLSDGDGQRAAYAALAIPGATVWYNRGHILHHRRVGLDIQSKTIKYGSSFEFMQLFYSFIYLFFYCALLTFKGCFTGSLASVLMSSAAASNWDSTGPERC